MTRRCRCWKRTVLPGHGRKTVPARRRPSSGPRKARSTTIRLTPRCGRLGTADSDGTVFRIVRYAPGVAPRHHRTNSIDYAVVMSGSMDMELDNQTVRLNAGDLLV